MLVTIAGQSEPVYVGNPEASVLSFELSRGLLMAV